MHARMALEETNIQLELKLIRDEGQQGQTPASAAKGRLRKQPLLLSGTGDLVTMLTYLIPLLPQFSLVRSVLKPTGHLSLVAESAGVKNYL